MEEKVRKKNNLLARLSISTVQLFEQLFKKPKCVQRADKLM